MNSLFSNANKPATGGGAGTGGGTQTGGSGLFANTNASAGAGGGSGGGLFGNKPAGNTGATGGSSGGLFGNTNTAGAGAGAGTGTTSTTGGGLFGNKPAGTTGGTTGGTGGGLFGNTATGGATGTGTTSTTGGGGLFGGKPAGTTGTTTGGGLFGGGAGGQQQQQQQAQLLAEQPAYTTPFEKYLKACQFSNDYLYDLIVDPRPIISKEDFRRILNDRVIKEKVLGGLAFYKDRSFKRDEAMKGMVEGQIKWPGKIPISRRALEFINAVSEKLNLSIMQTFELFELYFEFDKPLLDRITYWHPQNPINYQIEEEIAKAEKKIINQYYKERITLLECIYQIIVIVISPSRHKLKGELEKFVRDLFSAKGEFVNNIWKVYTGISEINVSEILQVLTGLQEREEWGLQNLKEQYHLIKVLYIAFFEIEECDPTFFLNMLKYFHNQAYSGSFFILERQVTIQSVLKQRHEYASMINDICLLTLINCLKLEDAVISMDDGSAVTDVNPLVIFSKVGKDVTSFLRENLSNTTLIPIIVAWRRLINLFDAAEDKNVKECVKNAKSVDFDSDPAEYATIMFEITNRPLFRHQDKISLHFFRDTLKAWVSLLAQEFKFENLVDYEKLTDIACECLKESQNLESFWSSEKQRRIGIGALLAELLKLFPFRSTKLIKLVTTLAGNRRFNYAVEVLKLFYNLNSFCSEVHHDTRDFKKSEKNRNISFVDRQIDDLLIRIPSQTPAELLLDQNTSRIYQFQIKYNFWDVLYKQWCRLFYPSGSIENFNPPKPILKLINLVCKLIIIDNNIADILEEYLLPEDTMRSNSQTIGISLLLLTTLSSFRNLRQMPYKTVSLIYKALASLQAHPSHSSILGPMIQLFPRSLQYIEQQQYGSTLAINPSRVIPTPASSIGYRASEASIHPVLDIFNTIKKSDDSIESYEKKYSVYISILEFAYEIISTSEFIFDQYANEKFVNAISNLERHKVNEVIDEGAKLVNAVYAGNDMWSIGSLQNIRQFLQDGRDNNKLILYSSFIDDLFTLVFKNIFEDYDQMLFSPTLLNKKWKMGSYLLKIINLLLNKFTTNLDRVCTIYTQPVENPLLTHIIHHLNNSKIPDFILKILEVVIHKDFIKDNKFSEGFNPLGIENKYWMTFIHSQDSTPKQVEGLRQMIKNALLCVETIVNLIEVNNENLNINTNDASLVHQLAVSKLDVVNTFEKILTRKESLYQYVHNDMKQTIKINIILAIFSYVNFEVSKNLAIGAGLDPEIEKFLSDPKFITSAIISEEDVDNIEIMLQNIDPELTKNILLKPHLKNNQQVSGISELAIRILTKLVAVWEDQGPQKKLSLFDHLTSISHPEPQFTSNKIARTITHELLSTLIHYEGQPEEACALIEMLTVCLHSQNNFVDCFLKTPSTYTIHQHESFLTFIKIFFSSNVEPFKPLLVKLIIFINEVFQQEARYASFVRAIRTENNLIQNIFASIFRSLNPNYSLVSKIRDYSNLISSDLQPSQIKNIAFQLEKLIIEGLIMQECSNIFAVIIAIRFLTHELISSGDKSKKEGLNISLCIKELFSGLFVDWLEAFKHKGFNNISQDRAFQYFLEELQDPKNFYVFGEKQIRPEDSRTMLQEMDGTTMQAANRTLSMGREGITISEYKKYQRRKLKQYSTVMNVETEELVSDKKAKISSIIIRTIYKIMDVNLYGYGRDYLYDTQEIFFAMRNSNYKEDFTYQATLFLSKQNLVHSLVTLENKCSNAMITLFKLISTLGLTGQSFSTVFYEFSVITPNYYALPMVNEFDNEREITAINPNNKLAFLYGFPDFFTRVTATDPLEKKVTASAVFLEKVIRLVWGSLRQEDKDFEVNLSCLKSIEAKINFLTYAFNSLFYLLEIANSLPQIQKNTNFQRNFRNEPQMEKEALPLVLEDSGLGEVIKDMFYNLNTVLWPKILEAFKLLEIDISQYVIFQMVFLQCTKLTAKYINLDRREIKNYVEIFEIFLRGNISCFSLVASCFELLHSIGSHEFLTCIEENQSRLTSFLMSKLSLEGTYEVEALFVAKLFADLSRQPEGALHLKNSNLIWELCYNKKLKKVLEGNDYENGQRSIYQVYWCWILIILRQMIEQLHQEPGFMNSVITLLREFWPRINYILTLPTEIFGKDTPRDHTVTSMIMQEKPSNTVKFTVAYFEELECTTALLFELFQHPEQWTLINRPLFELTLYNIMHHTLKLFKPINTIVEASTSNSALEKLLEQTLALDKRIVDKTNINFKDISSTSGSANRKSLLENELFKSHKDKMSGLLESYNPTVFAYKIEVSLLNSLSCLLYSVKNGLRNTELLNYFEIFDVMKADPSKITIKYDLSYWDNFFHTLDNLQNHLLHNFNKWMAHMHIVERVSKKYDYLNNSVTSSVQTYGLSANFQSYGFDDFRDLTKTMLELVFYIISLHYTMFKEFKTSQHSFVEGEAISNKTKITSLLEKCSTLLNNKAVFPTSWAEVNRGAKGGISDIAGPTAGTNDLFAILRDSLR